MQWKVKQMDCYPEKDGEPDVVFTVHWILSHTEGGYTGKVYGTVVLQLDPYSPFTPYDQLTETQVIGWVKSALGPKVVAEYEDAVMSQIQEQKNPPVVTPPLPW